MDPFFFRAKEFKRFDLVWARYANKWWPAMIDLCPDENAYEKHHLGKLFKIFLRYFHGPSLWQRPRFIFHFKPDEIPSRENREEEFSEAHKKALEALAMPRKERGGYVHAHAHAQ